ncbi:MAG TPA: 30S ribosomal protein S18 [Patescibacteria group bacterium]|nr:30S ribosomal protein S18 [Patescibacteria group bacterium]
MKDKNKKKKVTRRRQEEVRGECFFCKEKKAPDFLEYEILGRYTSERGKILSKTRTGVCSKHQRGVTSEIKRARYIGLMPFVVGLE